MRGNPSVFSDPRPFPYLTRNPTNFGYISVRSAEVVVDNAGSIDDASIARLFDHNFSNTIFYLRPQRVSPTILPYGEAAVLTPSGDNLQLVLLFLQNKRPDIFNNIVRHLDYIVGNINEITLAARPTGCEIMIWPSAQMGREELSFRLVDSGTGIAQCLTILVAASSDDPACIIVDEINSFLHPRAVRKLIETLRGSYGHHQYIISTHSPEVIAYSGPSTAYYVEKTGFDSNIRKLDLAKIEDGRAVYRSLGISMMDVFGASRIIWVEGQTEEICFPILFHQEGDSEVIFKAVPATGDFTAKKRTKKMVMDLYKSVANSVAPLVENMVFAFDREDLSEEARVAFEKEAGPNLKLLPRRNFESYLLHPLAIAEVINTYVPGVTDEEGVRGWLKMHGGEAKYGAPTKWSEEIDGSDWLEVVDGAKLIKDMFSDLTENVLEFRKTKHSPEIMIQIKKENESNLSEMRGFIGALMQQVML